jgi:hypothetical protein
MSDQEGDGDGEGYYIFGLQVGRTHVELPVEPIRSVILCLYALLVTQKRSTTTPKS